MKGGVGVDNLTEIFWNDLHSLDLKGECFVEARHGKMTLLSQLVWDPLWKLYKSSCVDFDFSKLPKLLILWVCLTRIYVEKSVSLVSKEEILCDQFVPIGFRSLMQCFNVL